MAEDKDEEFFIGQDLPDTIDPNDEAYPDWPVDAVVVERNPLKYREHHQAAELPGEPDVPEMQDGAWKEWFKQAGITDQPPPKFEDEPPLEPLPEISLPPESTWRKWPAVQLPRLFDELKLTQDMYPPDSIFQRYSKYMAPLSTMLPHDWGTVCAAIAAILGPYWRIRSIDGEDLRLNLFIALIGDSS